jgi:8-oxo-dGTP pyrophosphatase MutT (NUDIX family)
MSSEPDPRDPNGPKAPAAKFSTHPSLGGFNVSVKAYRLLNPGFDAIAVGALIFRAAPLKEDALELLLIQRSDSEFFPAKWEIPGGACDLEDETILHGLAREVWEETGLELACIGRQVGLGGAPKPVSSLNGAAFVTPGGIRVMKYSFIVDVGNAQRIVLNPNEHQRYLWVAGDDFKNLKCHGTEMEFTTEQQFATIAEAFRVVKSDE